MDKAFLTTFAASLFALINPLGILPVFISYTAKQSKGVQKWLSILLLLVGPGVIANVILYANEVEANKNEFQLVELAVVCVMISVLVCAILLSGRWLQQVLGNIGLSIATRILGLLVASIGV